MFETYEGENPRHQFQIQSRFNLPRNLELDSGLYHVSSLSSINIPRYTRLDLRFGWRAKEYLELSLSAQNLLDDHHPEFNGHDTVAIMSQARRSVYAKASWRF
jgi:iron complex outermembrane receptor protein